MQAGHLRYDLRASYDRISGESMTEIILGAIVALIGISLLAIANYRYGVEVGRHATLVEWSLPIGDGKTDDTAAIQRLVNDVSAGVVRLPPRIFKIGSKPLQIDNEELK